MMSNFGSLADLGWQTFFQQQLALDEWDDAIPASVVEQHKSEVLSLLRIHVLFTFGLFVGLKNPVLE